MKYRADIDGPWALTGHLTDKGVAAMARRLSAAMGKNKKLARANDVSN